MMNVSYKFDATKDELLSSVAGYDYPFLGVVSHCMMGHDGIG